MENTGHAVWYVRLLATVRCSLCSSSAITLSPSPFAPNSPNRAIRPSHHSVLLRPRIALSSRASADDKLHRAWRQARPVAGTVLSLQELQHFWLQHPFAGCGGQSIGAFRTPLSFSVSWLLPYLQIKERGARVRLRAERSQHTKSGIYPLVVVK